MILNWRASAVVFAALVTMGACSRHIVVDGFNVHEGRWNRERPALVQRASFDMDCPADQIEVTVLSARSRFVLQAAVNGCGRRAVYDNGFDGVWVAELRSQ